MDGLLAIENNRMALKRILTELIVMAGLSDAEADRGVKATIRRSLAIAVLRILRPAEAAARRLIIALARDLPRPQLAGSTLLRSREADPAVRDLAPSGAPGVPDHRLASNREPATARSANPSFPLLDPLRQFFRHRQNALPNYALPRISIPGVTPDAWRSSPSSPYDLISAARLNARLAALERVLDDMPRHARRFARWSAVHERQCSQQRTRRLSPLRFGKPPGCRLTSWNPDVYSRSRKIREVDRVLAHANALAQYALQRRDSS